MKKLFLTAAIAALAFASCTKEKNSTDNGTQNLTVKITNAETRALQAPGTAIAATLSSGHIFLIDPSGNVYPQSPALVVAEATGTGQVIAAVPSSARVYIVGNIPSDATGITSLTNIAAIQAAVSDIATNQGILYTDAPLINETGAPVGITLVTSNTATASIALTPVYARLELEGVTGGTYVEKNASDDPTGNQSRITAFTVTGVYVDSYYPQFNYGGTGSGTVFQQLQSTVFNGIGDPGSWVASGAPLKAAPASLNWWGYNVPGAGLPRLIIALTGIEYEVSADDGENWAVPATPAFSSTATYYVTVSGYNGGTVTSFTRGNIYQIAADKMVFSTNDLHTTPNPTTVTLTVTVTVRPWVLVPLNPDLM
jgi:hypothetical protein